MFCRSGFHEFAYPRLGGEKLLKSSTIYFVDCTASAVFRRIWRRTAPQVFAELAAPLAASCCARLSDLLGIPRLSGDEHLLLHADARIQPSAVNGAKAFESTKDTNE